VYRASVVLPSTGPWKVTFEYGGLVRTLGLVSR
jgi:hypothetical protein